MNANGMQAILIVVTVIAVAAAIFFAVKAQRTRRLRERFGPEYGRAVEESGSTARGEQRLANLEKRVARYNIRPLTLAERERFDEEWHGVQARFVDEPQVALQAGDRLVNEVMTTRGYPMADFEEQAADISVHHAAVVEHYRAGHEIALRQAAGQSGTEDLRQAMIHYRKLFDELVNEPEVVRTKAARV